MPAAPRSADPSRASLPLITAPVLQSMNRLRGPNATDERRALYFAARRLMSQPTQPQAQMQGQKAGGS